MISEQRALTEKRPANTSLIYFMINTLGQSVSISAGLMSEAILVFGQMPVHRKDRKYIHIGHIYQIVKTPLIKKHIKILILKTKNLIEIIIVLFL